MHESHESHESSEPSALGRAVVYAAWLLVIVTAAAFIVLALGAALSRAEAADDGYGRGRAEALRTGRPLIVLVGAEWCADCKELAKHHSKFETHGVFVHLDAERHAPVVRALGIAYHGVEIGVALPVLIVWRRAHGVWVRRYYVGTRAIETFLVESD
jgi:hypothetical protein